MPRQRELRHINSRGTSANALQRRIAAAGASDLFGATFAQDDCDLPVATATIDYLGFNNNTSINQIRGIGESGGELILGTDSGVWRATRNVSLFGALISGSQITAVQNGSTITGVMALTVSQSGVIWWGEDDGKIYRWTGAAATEIASIPALAYSGGPTEFSMNVYSTDGNMATTDTSKLRVMICGIDVAGLWDLAGFSANGTLLSSNVTGGSTARGYGFAANNCGGIYHAQTGVNDRVIYRSMTDIDTAVDTGLDTFAGLGLCPSSMNNGFYSRQSFSFDATNGYNNGSAYVYTGTLFTGWSFNVGAVGPTQSSNYVNVMSNTSEVLRIVETQ